MPNFIASAKEVRMSKTVDQFKTEILAYVRANDRCTFADMMAAIPGSEGEYAAEILRRNVILWGPMSHEMATALSELWHGHKIFYVPCETLLPYVAAGEVLNLPIVRDGLRRLEMGYRTKHWLPVLLTVHHPVPDRAAADFAAWARLDADRAGSKGRHRWASRK
jgi:hypothetical protein